MGTCEALEPKMTKKAFSSEDKTGQRGFGLGDSIEETSGDKKG